MAEQEQFYIVAEVSKRWYEDASEDTISSKFELVIATNYARGYTLYDWKLNSVVNDEGIYETIVAVFKKY